VAYDVFFPRKHPSGFPSMSHRFPQAPFSFSLDLMRIAALILLVGCSAALAETRYTHRMFRRALEEAGSTSPLYMLFTLNDPIKHTRRVVSAPATGLLGAIHFEYHLDFDTAGLRKAADIAASQPRHEFTFHSRKALHNVRPYYSEAILADVRQRLARRSNQELIHDGMLYTEHPHYTLDEIYAKRDRDSYNAYRDATAHVLLERGILVGEDDRTGLLYTQR
jgi:hypothetical protein